MNRRAHPSDRFLVEAEARRIEAQATRLERQADDNRRYAAILRGQAR